MKTVGIFGKKDNKEVLAVKEKLEELGAETEILDLTDYPADPRPFMTGEDMMIGDVNADSLYSVYVNSLCLRGYPFLHTPKDKWDEYYASYLHYVSREKENSSFRYSYINYLILKGCLVLNAPSTYNYHAMKVYEYFRLEKRGYKVPETISGSDPERLKAFIRRMGGKALYKANVGGYLHTVLVDEAVIDDVAESLTVRPVILQRYIKGYNIRCFVLEDSFLGAAKIIQTDEFVDSRVDSKGLEVVEMPEDVKKTAIDAVRDQGLIFSGLDFMVSEEDGEYYLLEANSSPMFANYENMTGLDIAGPIAKRLVK
ncbi:hypothetical protein KAU32_03325 [bacterium]|nr:hypothetical protein [bacterium]